MPSLRLLSSLILLLSASGCVLLPSLPPPTPPLLSPVSLGQPHSASPTLNAAFGTTDLSLQCALEADAQAVTLIAIGPFGARVLRLHYDGQTLESKTSKDLPGGLPPAQMLSDLQFVLWPTAAWQSALSGSDWQFSEPTPGLRRLRYRGRLIAEVHYADGSGDPWNGRAWLSNLAYGYTIDLGTQTP